MAIETLVASPRIWVSFASFSWISNINLHMRKCGICAVWGVPNVFQSSVYAAVHDLIGIAIFMYQQQVSAQEVMYT